MNETILVVLTALCSGLIATIITLWWQNKSQEKASKLHIFTVLMSNRYEVSSEASVNALNMIDVVFYHAPKVRVAWRNFVDATNLPDSQAKLQTINDKHLRLLEVIAEDIGYKDIRWDDIKQYYYPVGLSDRKRDEAILRRVQINASLAQINESKKNEETAQVNANDQFANQMLRKL